MLSVFVVFACITSSLQCFRCSLCNVVWLVCLCVCKLNGLSSLDAIISLAGQKEAKLWFMIRKPVNYLPMGVSF
jgi:hypothetical protein